MARKITAHTAITGATVDTAADQFEIVDTSDTTDASSGTNKKLTPAELENIYVAGDLVGTSDTQTLTNKTIDAANNTVSLTADSVDAITEIAAALKSGSDGTVVTGTAGTNGNTGQWNADGDLVDGKALPSGDIVGTTDTQTLTNKTLTTPVISTISNSGTVTLPTGTVTLVGRTTTDTLTNKTLTAPVISTISNSGTVTLPTGTVTLVARSTTDTLTNKTFTNPAHTHQTLTDGASIAWNMNNGHMASVTLAGNRTLAAPTNIKTGGIYYLRVIQDATGTRTLAYNSVFKFPGGTAPVLSTAGSSTDVLMFVSFDGTNLLGVPNYRFS